VKDNTTKLNRGQEDFLFGIREDRSVFFIGLDISRLGRKHDITRSEHHNKTTNVIESTR